MKGMKKITLVSLAGALLFALPAFAQSSTFSISLGVGATDKVEVTKLQNFLIGQGLLTGSASGLYLSLTQKAVAAFQTKQGIAPASGYFGALTRAAANKIALGGSSGNQASIQVTAVQNSTAAAAVLAATKTITWQASGYPTNAHVNINLLRKSSGVTSSYTLVRALAKDVVNDGQETWTPRSGETGNDLYIEVTCAGTVAQGCRSNIIRAN